MDSVKKNKMYQYLLPSVGKIWYIFEQVNKIQNTVEFRWLMIFKLIMIYEEILVYQSEPTLDSNWNN